MYATSVDCEVVVHRHNDGAEARRGVADFEALERVFQQRGDLVARLESSRAQAVGQAVHARIVLATPLPRQGGATEGG